MPRLAALGALAAAAAAAAWVAVDPADSGLLLLAALGLLVAGAAWLETGPDAAKEIVPSPRWRRLRPPGECSSRFPESSP